MTELSFEQLVYIFENDDIFPVDETTFHFDFERTEQHYPAACASKTAKSLTGQAAVMTRRAASLRPRVSCFAQISSADAR